MLENLLASLGSTGSIGIQTLEICRQSPNLNITGLTCNSNTTLLKKQIDEFHPDYYWANKKNINIENSKLNSPINIATDPNLDILVVATEGLSSLEPVLKSLEKSKTIALANKESILCGADLIYEKLNKYSGKLIPLDSEPASVKGILSKTNKNPKKINKIKKQPTEKRIYNVKDYVVYPKHGVGKIVAIERAKIEKINKTFYKVFIEKEKLTLSIPLNQQSHLRHVSSINQINRAFTILKSKPKIKRTMWSRRAQEYEQKINSGKLYDLAEVVRDLNKKTDVIAEQSYSERQLFEKAYERLKSEFEVILGEKAKIKMDKALNRTE